MAGATIELNESSTHEDIQAAVDQAIANRTAPEGSDKPGDGSRIASETDQVLGDKADDPNDESTVDDEGGDEDNEDTAIESKSGGETTSKGPSKAPKWLDDELKAEIAAYGIGEDELADFTSREEVERALRFLDKSAADAGRKAAAKATQDRNEKGQFQKKEADQGKSDDKERDQPAPNGAYEVKLNRDVYDDGIVDEFTRMRDHYESRMSSLEARIQASDAIAEEQTFDNLVDGLGHADLFGKTGKETDQEFGRRKQLIDEVRILQAGLRAMGRPSTLNEGLLKRAVRSAFSAELDKKLIKNQTRRITKQSNGRQGGGATRPTDPPETLREEMRRKYAELEQS